MYYVIKIMIYYSLKIDYKIEKKATAIKYWMLNKGKKNYN